MCCMCGCMQHCMCCHHIVLCNLGFYQRKVRAEKAEQHNQVSPYTLQTTGVPFSICSGRKDGVLTAFVATMQFCNWGCLKGRTRKEKRGGKKKRGRLSCTSLHLSSLFSWSSGQKDRISLEVFAAFRSLAIVYIL